MGTQGNCGKPESVLITGAEGALGREVVRAFLESGTKKVHATYHRELPAELVPLKDRGVHWVQADVTDPRSVASALGGLEPDALVHCAGGFRYSSVADVSDQDLSFLIDLNLKSAFYLARALVPSMKRKGFGRIVFVGAKATLAPGAGMGPYTATKIGLNALTASLTEELKGTGVNVNAVLPSIIDTPANRKDMPSADHSKWVAPAALARIIVSLTGEQGAPIAGALIPVAGGV